MMISVKDKDVAERYEVRLSLVVLLIGIVGGFILSSLLWVFEIESYYEARYAYKVQYSALLDECIIDSNREVHKLDNHLKCFEDDKIVDLDYTYKFDKL